ncbi:hypothetical protein fugu_012391 [Takifugu bimaculatus]|uniref:EF-hand domain-containing protein n=1 Tax=Takifugu bimaculatus TaxID=433685 RepID=A0A4Z2C594_9TELE|nr:hypothetical protein fugu_012391 [Takifugu bimaculatus]
MNADETYSITHQEMCLFSHRADALGICGAAGKHPWRNRNVLPKGAAGGAGGGGDAASCFMMMEDDDHGDYISQLRAEFDSCDSSASGFLDRDELTALCQKLHLESHLQQLLDTLLRRGACGRVNFEEFKDGFVAVLSRSLDLSTSEDDSSYLEPVIPEEVKPKFVKGKKRYGRRSRPDKPESALSQGSEDFGPPGVESSDLSPSGIRRAKLRRSTSLESIESLKSDVEPANQEKSDGPRLEEDAELRGNGGGVKMVNDDLDLEPVNAKELLQKLDSDLDTSISKRDFHIMRDSHPLSSSTPSRSLDQKRGPHRVRSTFNIMHLHAE